MKKGDIDQIIDNEREWRRHLLERITSIEKEMVSLKGRVAVISSSVGAIVSVGFAWFKHKFIGG